MSSRDYYIQNVGFCGDCLRWWRKGRNGYTLNLDEAMRVTKKEAMAICRQPTHGRLPAAGGPRRQVRPPAREL